MPDRPAFHVEILGETAAPLVSGITLPPDRAAAAAESDIVIVPSIVLRDGGWTPGRYRALSAWIAERHRAGATICSACSGIFLIAKIGLFDEQEATVHWHFFRAFGALYPTVVTRPGRALVVSGARGELATSGERPRAGPIGREVGPVAAQAASKFFTLRRHIDGPAPLSCSTRRAATHAPLDYVQRVRIEQAKRLLERTPGPIEDVAWRVGYEAQQGRRHPLIVQPARPDQRSKTHCVRCHRCSWCGSRTHPHAQEGRQGLSAVRKKRAGLRLRNRHRGRGCSSARCPR